MTKTTKTKSDKKSKATVAKPAKAVKKAAKKIVEVDTLVTHAAAQGRNNPVMKAIGFLSEAADQPPLIALSLGTLAIGLATRRADVARGGARMLASHLLATAAKSAIKHRINRTRPGAALDMGEQRFERGHSREHDLSSFPSGHTAGAVAVALAAGHDIEGAGVPAVLAAGAVAAAQAPTGHHYLTDVVVGGAVGWAVESVVSAVFDRFEPPIEQAIKDAVA
jgi:membrane-associated phospholipid phosphatase